ncbi:MAG: toxin [Spirochaetes bacterium]|nr:toxin [Spirochaetota bacterium]
MKKINWDIEKNRILRDTREISFEDILFYIEKGNLLDIIQNPNSKKYTNQHVLVVEIKGYVYCVPYVEYQDEIFLKTVFPSRKLTKHYLGGKK